ncbi:MAG: DUF177 domain-containing protein [Firmicutes bacterium]|nr:DUF177 domain-containing protein [Bacillota bacterium]
MHVRVADVKKWVGRSERSHLEEPWPAAVAERTGSRLADPGLVDVLVRNTGAALVVEITGTAEVEATCSRCLKPFRLTVPFSAVEEFREEPGPPDEWLGYSRYQADELDLDDVIADAVALAMPMAPVCRPDCRGLCPVCGADRNEIECGCVPEADPRWEALRGLTFEGREGPQNGSR